MRVTQTILAATALAICGQIYYMIGGISMALGAVITIVLLSVLKAIVLPYIRGLLGPN